jgi:acyl-CoA dehydrogenase
MTTLSIVALLAAGALLFAGRTKAAWILPAAAWLLSWAVSGPASWLGWLAAAALFGAALWLLADPARRSELVTRRLAPRIAALLPKLGATERVALEAGTVWWDAALFSGRPVWRELLAFEPRPLSAAEQAVLSAGGPRVLTIGWVHRDGQILGQILDWGTVSASGSEAR